MLLMIISFILIKEENQNEYVVAATKYDTGKFITIENFTAEDFLPDTYYSGPSKVGNVVVEKLDSPIITKFTTGSADSNGFSLIAEWDAVEGAQAYSYNIYNEILNQSQVGEAPTTSIEINNLKDLGDWKLELRSISTQAGKINSELSKTGIFVAYYNNIITPYPKASILNFTIA
jgi:hypothetical protein